MSPTINVPIDLLRHFSTMTLLTLCWKSLFLLTFFLANFL